VRLDGCVIDLDAIAEPPFDAKDFAHNAIAHPEAAEVLADLLGKAGDLSIEDAIEQESLAYARLQGGDDHRQWLAHRKTPACMEPGSVELSRQGVCLQIKLDRPDAHNAIDVTMRDGLREAFDLAALDPEISSVRLTGQGKAFCIGGDLAEFGTTKDPARAHEIRMATLPALAMPAMAHKLEAHIQGACIGAGLEIAAFARRISATPDSWFQLPELAMGLIPGAGGCVSIPRRIGVRRTLLLVLSGKRINAITALDWGLVDAIIDD
jgi:hypothetical protein